MMPAMYTSPKNAASRCVRACALQVCEHAALDFGDAYLHTRFPELPECNFIANVATDEPAADVIHAGESFFQQRGGRRPSWQTAADGPIGSIDAQFRSRGYGRYDLLCQILPTSVSTPAARTSHVLSARSMPKSFRALLKECYFEKAPRLAEARLEIAITRLDDPQWEPLIAMAGDAPVGMAALHSVGDVGALHELFVTPSARQTGVAAALLAHARRTAARWGLNPLISIMEESDAVARSWHERHGWEIAGRIARWTRPEQCIPIETEHSRPRP